MADPALRTRRRSPRRTAHPYLVVLAWFSAITFAFPVIWMLFVSLHSEQQAVRTPPAFFDQPTLENFAFVFNVTGANNVWHPLVNSLIASLGATVLVIVLGIPAAYALSIRPIRHWRDVMIFFLSMRMTPVVAGLLPMYLIARDLHLLDNIGLLIVMYTGINLPVAVWMLRSFLQEIPIEILEAAAVDGAPLITIFRRIVLPLIAPGVAATGLITFIFSWQELLLALSLTSINSGTVPVYLIAFQRPGGTFLASLAAASLVISIPVFIAGIAAQDRLVQGLSLGAVK